MSLTLTVAEIVSLARFAGLEIADRSLPDADGEQTELTIADCPTEGVFDDEESQRPQHFAHVAYFTEYREEGVMPLGPEIQKLAPKL